MINSMIKAISISLNKEFGDEYESYMEEIRQDLKEPCFFIQCLNPIHEQFLGPRYFRKNQFCIQFFPVTADKQQECNEVAERMTWCLEYVTIPGDDKPIRGTKMKSELVDGVLNFFVNYDCFVRKYEENTSMENLASKVDAKEGD